jgi:transcriptional regulator with XRE-family HTH domain
MMRQITAGVHTVSPPLVMLGETIRKRRKAAELTQVGLAGLAHLQRTYIADVERGARNVSMQNLVRIGNALNVSVPELCLGMI